MFWRWGDNSLTFSSYTHDINSSCTLLLLHRICRYIRLPTSSISSSKHFSWIDTWYYLFWFFLCCFSVLNQNYVNDMTNKNFSTLRSFFWKFIVLFFFCHSLFFSWYFCNFIFFLTILIYVYVYIHKIFLLFSMLTGAVLMVASD